jgi:hypothetical protein
LATFFLFPSKKFLPISLKNSAIGKFSPKTEGTKTKAGKNKNVSFSDVFSLLVHFEFFAIFSYCLHFSKFVSLLKRLQRLKQKWQKSPAGTYGRNYVWFGEIERNLAKL